MKAVAKLNFLRQGINYAKGEAVDLDEGVLSALERAGLVEIVEETKGTKERKETNSPDPPAPPPKDAGEGEVPPENSGAPPPPPPPAEEGGAKETPKPRSKQPRK